MPAAATRPISTEPAVPEMTANTPEAVPSTSPSEIEYDIQDVTGPTASPCLEPYVYDRHCLDKKCGIKNEIYKYKIGDTTVTIDDEITYTSRINISKEQRAYGSC